VSKQPYKIRVRNKMLDRWNELEGQYPEVMQELKDFLKVQPTNIRITNGRAKKLRGDLKGIYQFDINYTDRVRYIVDKKRFVVDVIYAKGRPED